MGRCEAMRQKRSPTMKYQSEYIISAQGLSCPLLRKTVDAFNQTTRCCCCSFQEGHDTISAFIALIKIKWEIVKPNNFQTSEPIEAARAHQFLPDQDKLDCSQFKRADTQQCSGVSVICILLILVGSAGLVSRIQLHLVQNGFSVCDQINQSRGLNYAEFFLITSQVLEIYNLWLGLSFLSFCLF